MAFDPEKTKRDYLSEEGGFKPIHRRFMND
jgi:hypothetical protein